MSWLEERGCGSCDKCGMDMDMEPFCVDKATLTEAEMRLNRDFPWGLSISTARIICKGDQWEERKIQ